MYHETLAGHDELCECDNCIYNRGKESSPSMNVLCRAVEVLEYTEDISDSKRTYLLYSYPEFSTGEDSDSIQKSPAKNRHGKCGAVNEREKVHACSKCGKRFTRRDNLLVHEITHTGDKPHECPICFKRFTRKGNLLTHMLTHTAERPFECQTCYKKFTTKDNLSRHMNTHYGVRLYTCDKCGRSFAEKATLTKHMVTHTDEKLFECPICLKRYKTKATLKRHLQGHETDEVETEEFVTADGN